MLRFLSTGDLSNDEVNPRLRSSGGRGGAPAFDARVSLERLRKLFSRGFPRENGKCNSHGGSAPLPTAKRGCPGKTTRACSYLAPPAGRGRLARVFAREPGEGASPHGRSP